MMGREATVWTRAVLLSSLGVCRAAACVGGQHAWDDVACVKMAGWMLAAGWLSGWLTGLRSFSESTVELDAYGPQSNNVISVSETDTDDKSTVLRNSAVRPDDTSSVINISGNVTEGKSHV